MRALRLVRRDAAVAAFDARRWRDGRAETFTDDVVVEEPLTVLLNCRDVEHPLGSTMRTPGDDAELAVGMALAEGVVTNRRQVVSVDADPACDSGARVVLRLTDDAHVERLSGGRVTSATSACGLCGRDDLDALVDRPGVTSLTSTLPPDALAALPGRLEQSQHVFRRTGGLHAAGLASEDGSLICVREDVGRHNAVDKVIGWATLNDIHPAALVVSGRAGFEIVQKAVIAGIPALVSVSATTSRAIAAARAAGLTLACFARDGAMTLYSPW